MTRGTGHGSITGEARIEEQRLPEQCSVGILVPIIRWIIWNRWNGTVLKDSAKFLGGEVDGRLFGNAVQQGDDACGNEHQSTSMETWALRITSSRLMSK